MNKTEIKNLIVRSHKMVTSDPNYFEPWEWENIVLDNLQVMLAKTWKTNWKKYYFLKGIRDYIDGEINMFVLKAHAYRDSYRNGLQATSELMEELKYFNEAFGSDFLTI